MAEKLRTFGWDNADQYWRSRRADAKVGEKRLHRFLAGLVRQAAPPGTNVLDCGAGEGHVLRLCQPDHPVYACDLSAEVLAGYAFPLAGSRCLDLNAGFPDFGVRFHAIVASWLLHWLDDPAAFLAAAAGHLAAGGRLIVNIPNITYARYRWEFLRGRFPRISLSHRNFQTPDEVERTIAAAGLAWERRLSPRQHWHGRLWPKLFSRDIVYVLAPAQPARRAA